MEKTPKSLRLHIGIFGRTNVGKSSFLNMVAGQDVAITSPVAGTTTDVVEKTMELLPLGPVVFLDTAGLDDTSVLAEKRLAKTKKVFDRAEVIILVSEPGHWDAYEEEVVREARRRKIGVIGVINKTDLAGPAHEFVHRVSAQCDRVFSCSSVNLAQRDTYVNTLKRFLIELCPDDFLSPPPLVGDLVPPGGLAILIVPIDVQAPKGRLILPQVQTLRDCLDADAAAMVVKEREYAHLLQRLHTPPDLVVCDSQVVLKMVADTPRQVKCTTFSTLFSRDKGDLLESVRGIRVIDEMKPGDKILIAEACSHHAIEDDIGRVKIPRWLRQFIGADVQVDVASGKDYPANLREYKLVVHCGGCMLNRREMLFRIESAREAGVAITNYGVCIAYVQGVLARILSPFPAAAALLDRNLLPAKE